MKEQVGRAGLTELSDYEQAFSFRRRAVFDFHPVC
jgi:hypothetical protein